MNLHPRLPRRSKGYSVEPLSQKVRLVDRAGPPGQDQERSLERILGGVSVAYDLLTNAQNHRPMSLDQGREGNFSVFVAIGDESRQQLAVAHLCDRPCVQLRLMWKADRLSVPNRHVRDLPTTFGLSRRLVGGCVLIISTFLELVQSRKLAHQCPNHK
jgi:hypothetical protein